MIFALPKKTKTIYKIRLFVVILTVLGVLLCFFERSKVLRAAFYIAFAFSVVFFWVLHKFLKTYRLKVSFGEIIISYEVFVGVKRICPFSAITYITKVQTPLARKNRLYALLLKSAPKSIIIPEMFETTVLKLQKTVRAWNGKGN